MQLELEFLHGVPARAPAAALAEVDDARDSAGLPLEIARGGAFLTALARHGLSPRVMSIGLWPAHPGRVRLVLRVRTPDASPREPSADATEGQP